MLGDSIVMTKSPSNKLVDHAPQIVPKGYWTFWFVLSLIGVIVGIVATFLWRQERGGVIFGMTSTVVSVAWAVIYWRVRHAK